MKIKIPDPSPKAMARFHFAAMCLWTALWIPTILWWRNSIPWLVTMSLYANFVGHFSAWDASKAALAALENKAE